MASPSPTPAAPVAAVSDAAVDAYITQALACFAAIAAPDRRLTARRTIAGHALQMEFVGPALADRLLPALAHHPEPTVATTDMHVHAWDLASTGALLPPPPWDAVPFTERGNVRAWDSERFSLSFDRRTDVFSAVDNQRRVGIYWTRDAEALANYTTAAPMHRLLQGWLRARGLFLFHAASIGRPDGGMLLAGRSGSGKSTTAALALASDLLYAGDDYALVEPQPSPRVHALYSTTKLNLDTLESMPGLRAALSNPESLGREKALLFLADLFPQQLATQFPLRAIVLPRRSGQVESTARRVSPLVAYGTIGPDTAFTLLGDARGTLAALKALMQQVPCIELLLGTDRQQLVRTLHAILDGQVG